MTTVLDEPTVQTQSTATQRLRTTMAGVRLSVTSLGVRKTLTPQQRAQAADTFGAEGAFMSAAKKLLDTAHPAFKRVTGVKNQAVQYWRGLSLPFPEPGLRLIRQDDIEPFNVQMTTLKTELDEAVAQLNEHYAELVDAARHRLGSLFNAGDYPDSLIGMFDFQWDFPSVEPPDYLRQLNPQLYEQEAQRVAARFDEAVQLAEQAFAVRGAGESFTNFPTPVPLAAEERGGCADGLDRVHDDFFVLVGSAEVGAGGRGGGDVGLLQLGLEITLGEQCVSESYSGPKLVGNTDGGILGGAKTNLTNTEKA